MKWRSFHERSAVIRSLFSLPTGSSAGTLTFGNTTTPVHGDSWFDHEWSTTALGAQNTGWDWFSVQLSDGCELMLGHLRRKDGRFDNVFGGTLIEPDGRTRQLSTAEIRTTVEGRWHSAPTNADYPVRWRIEIPAEQIDLHATPWVADQEMRVHPPYWEGAVDYSGTSRGERVTGHGYIEMTGYAESLQGKL